MKSYLIGVVMVSMGMIGIAGAGGARAAPPAQAQVVRMDDDPGDDKADDKGEAPKSASDHALFRATGTHKCQSRSSIRHLERLTVERHGEWIVIEATANAFLHHMMRNIAGLLIAIGRGEAAPSWAGEILEGRDRTRAAATAPADGLYLWSVRYPDAFGLPDRAGTCSASDPLSYAAVVP